MEEPKNQNERPLSENKKSKTFWGRTISITIGVLGIVIVLVIIGGGALLAGHVWNPKWNPFKQKTLPSHVEEVR